MAKKKSSRKIALQILNQWQKKEEYAEEIIQQYTHHYCPEESSFIRKIVLNTIKNLSLLDYFINELCNLEGKSSLRNILRLGICQISILKIPHYAATNETVNLASSKYKGFINAVLQNFIRKKSLEKNTIPEHILYSHPEWLWKKWKKQYSSQEIKELMKWNNTNSPIYWRINPFKNQSINLQEAEKHKDYYVLNSPIPQEWIEKGNIYIQDPSTLNSVRLLNPHPYEKILDACSAPGGKTFLLQCLCPKSEIFATDISKKRLSLLKENIHRLGLKNITESQWNWEKSTPKKWENFFEAILLDVPCSNTGVMRRRTDTRWRLQANYFQEISKKQLSILQNASASLKSKGRMIYSTCSIEPEENEEVIHQFLKRNSEFTLIKTTKTHPLKDKIDGSFACLLKKN